MGTDVGTRRSSRQIYQLNQYIMGSGGGESGIRTRDRVSPIHAFQACAFDHSATSPCGRTLVAGGGRRKGEDLLWWFVSPGARMCDGASPSPAAAGAIGLVGAPILPVAVLVAQLAPEVGVAVRVEGEPVVDALECRGSEAGGRGVAVPDVRGQRAGVEAVEPSGRDQRLGPSAAGRAIAVTWRTASGVSVQADAALQGRGVGVDALPGLDRDLDTGDDQRLARTGRGRRRGSGSTRGRRQTRRGRSRRR